MMRRKSRRPRPRTSRDQQPSRFWQLGLLPIFLFAATAVLLAPAAVLKKRSEIEVSLKVNRMSFAIGELGSAGLFNALATRSLTLLNVDHIELGDGVLELMTPENAPTRDGERWRHIMTNPGIVLTLNSEFARMTLQGVTLNQLSGTPGSILTLSWLEDEPHSLILRIDGMEVTGSIAAARTLRLSCDYCQIRDAAIRHDLEGQRLRFTSTRDHVVAFRSKDRAPTMAFDLSPGTPLVERDISIAGGVDFTRTEGRSRTSTIIGEAGKITFDELRREVKVGAGDFVILENLKHFFVKTLSVDDGIRVILHGSVGALSTGPAGFVRSRLPSWLEWLYAREAWVLYFQALVLVATTAVAVLKRLKVVSGEE